MTTSEKTCFKCQKLKDLNEFYRHSQMGDGRLNKCKECTKKDVAEHRAANIERIREYDRNRGNRQGYAYTKEWRERFPKKYRAHRMVGYKVSSGQIVKPDVCESCAKPGYIEGHHDDYDKPLEVRWLCAPCHKQWHTEHGEAKNAA